ncbi:MAG: hypothetical protein PHD39_03020 [Methylobacter tundripaludum]|nr:hypothetical protein [Methylobacter tundripaludum]
MNGFIPSEKIDSSKAREYSRAIWATCLPVAPNSGQRQHPFLHVFAGFFKSRPQALDSNIRFKRPINSTDWLSDQSPAYFHK